LLVKKPYDTEESGELSEVQNLVNENVIGIFKNGILDRDTDSWDLSLTLILFEFKGHHHVIHGFLKLEFKLE
jgi:hypothetical protein